MRKIGRNCSPFCKYENGKRGIVLQSERLWSLDFLKAVAILAVVLGHIASPLSRFIFAWHMPAFFFASGVLLWAKREKDNRLSVFDPRDFSRLGRYYVFFGFLGIAAENIKIWALGRPAMDLWETVAGFLYFMDMPHLHHYGFILWFLPALFWGKMFTRALLCYGKKQGYILVGAGFLFLLGWMMPSEIPVGFGIHEGLLAVLWCALGCLSAAVWGRGRMLSVFGTLAFAAALGAIVFLPIPQLDLASYMIPNPWYNVCYSVLVIYSVLFLGQLLEKRVRVFDRGIELISRYSIYIMGFHVYTNNAALVFLQHFHREEWWMAFFLSCALLVPMLLFVRFLQSLRSGLERGRRT